VARAARALAADAVAVLAFVAVGRRNHDSSTDPGSVVATALPFLVALGIGWLATRAWRRPTHPAVGLAVWAITVVGGLALRRLVFGGGIAAAFVVVATVTLFALLVGWRLAAAGLSRRRS